ncbi:MAG: winged helix-turn-helix transcriptional regulator [Acidobacteriota bacterium]|nr:winged helix-turn-helix transcriptional regulator [Acidobacteriota bacterium]
MSAEAADTEALWGAVADPSRRRVLDVILARGEATATEIAREVPFSRQAVMKHLAVLDRAGLVSAHRRGREVLYVASPERVGAAVKSLARVADLWDRRLSSIKRLAERAHREGRPGS